VREISGTHGVSGRLASWPVGRLACESTSYDWQQVHETLAAEGVAVLPAFVDETTAKTFAAWYAHDELFRSRIVMERHNFGKGEYKYFAAPLPPPIQALREALYEKLAPLANRWADSE